MNRALVTYETLMNSPPYVLWEPHKEKGEKGGERIYEKIMAENFPNLMYNINL